MKANLKFLILSIIFWLFIYSCIGLSGCSSTHKGHKGYKNPKTSAYRDGFAGCHTYN